MLQDNGGIAEEDQEKIFDKFGTEEKKLIIKAVQFIYC
jgi:K+-sensing histidine kinase KdpD